MRSLRAVRVTVALLADAFVAFGLPLPVLLWTVAHWPTWLPDLCRSPAGDPGTGCEGWYFLLFFLILPLVSLMVGVLYVGLSVWRGRTPMMMLLARDARLSRQAAIPDGKQSKAARSVAVAVVVALVVGVAGVILTYNQVSDALEHPTIVPESSD